MRLSSSVNFFADEKKIYVRNIMIEFYNMSDRLTFVIDNANELPIDSRRDLLQIIYSSKFRKAINEKGSGCQINLANLSQSIIDELYDFIILQLEELKLDF
jgi:hypothetical protein